MTNVEQCAHESMVATLGALRRWTAASTALRAGEGGCPTESPTAAPLLSQNQRQSILVVPDHDHLGVRAPCQILRRLDSLPFEQRRRNPLGHDLLEIPHARSLDPLALRFLRF